MDEQEHHQHLIDGLRGQLELLFRESPQGIYIYKDDAHKACNEQFSQLLGLESPEAFAGVESMLDSFVLPESQDEAIRHYIEAREQLKASAFSVKLQTQTGQQFDAQIIMVPIMYEGHALVLHFVSKD